MQRVIMTVGCPGSGKTTFAKACNPQWVILSLDDVRASFFRSKRWYHDNATKAMKGLVNDTYEQSLRTALGYGHSVIIANTNIMPGVIAPTLEILKRFEITPEIRVFDVPLSELLRRNEWRQADDFVPDHVIRQFHCDMFAAPWWRRFPHTTETNPQETFA